MLDSSIVQNVLGLYKFNHLFPASSRLALKYTALVQLPFLHNYHQSNQLIRIFPPSSRLDLLGLNQYWHQVARYQKLLIM